MIVAAAVSLAMVACGGTSGGANVPPGNPGDGLPDAGSPAGGGSALFSHPPDPAGGLIRSSQNMPDGADADVWAYDEFTLASPASVAEVSWLGGYAVGAYGRVAGFTVTFFETDATGAAPKVSNPQRPDSEIYLARFSVAGDAGETAAGALGGRPVYQYKFVLPAPFAAAGGVKYWLRIEAVQGSLPDWGLAVGTGGDGTYYRFTANTFQTMSGGDAAFTLR